MFHTVQERIPKLRHKREVKLGLPPSSDFRWFSSILHRKRTTESKSNARRPAVVHDIGQHHELQTPNPTPQQNHEPAIITFSTAPVRCEPSTSGTTPGILANDTDPDPRALPDMASAGSSTAEPAQSGLHFAPLTDASQSKTSTEHHTAWDESPHKLATVEQVGTHQKQGTATKSSQDIEASLNDNPNGIASRISSPGNPNTGVSREGRSQEKVSRQRERVKEVAQPEHSEWAKEHVWQILRHKLRGAEGISGSVVVEIELHGTQQMLIVKCYGPAATRAREIRKLLEKTRRGLASQGFILSITEETRVGTDFSLLWGPGPSDNTHSGSDLSDFAPMAIFSDQPPRQGHTPRTAPYYEADRFANTPYWNSTSILVDCLFPPRPQFLTNTLCGALVRMMSWEHQGESQLRTWTCGGIVHVNGVPYALTTAHPLVSNHRGKEQDGVGATKPSVIDDVFPTEYGLFSEAESNRIDGTQSWQTLGRVHKHAMSSGDRVPANYDWLLIDISKDYLLPNFPAGYDRDGDLGEKSGDPESVSICTWRGSLQATLLPEHSFMILGQSSFEAMKMSVDQPMGGSDLAFDVQLVLQLTEYSARRFRFMGLQRRRCAWSCDSWQHRG
jgi:hypothetical protein